MTQIIYTFGDTQIQLDIEESRYQWYLYNDYIEKEDKAFRNSEVYMRQEKEWEEGEVVLQELKKEINKHKHVKDLFFGGSKCLCGARYYRACPTVDKLWGETKELLNLQRRLQYRMTFRPTLFEEFLFGQVTKSL